MKILQKRYIYAGILASCGFTITYLLLDFGLLLSLLITLMIYISGIFLFKEKDVREYDADDINRYHFETSKLASFKDRIKNKKINESIVNICEVSTKILSALTQKPKKVTQVYNFYDYYMNLLLKLIQRYNYLENKNDLTELETKFLDNSENYIINIEEQFKKQLDNMYKTTALDIQKEIKMFENICSIEGLDKEVEEGEKE